MSCRLPASLLACLAIGLPATAQTVTVTTAADTIDINPTTATLADLPGPDGLVSFAEAMIATNNTPGHQTVGFAIPQDEWPLQFLYPGCAVLTGNSHYWRALDSVTIDGTTQTAFTGDTNPDGAEVAVYGGTLRLIAAGCTIQGFHGAPIDVSGSGGVVTGNTAVSVTVFGCDGTLVQGNDATTIKVDRASHTVVVGNTCQRVRVLGGGPPVIGTRIGGPAPGDRNLITGYGTYNSDGYPSGSAIQLAYSDDTLIENNQIGTTVDGLAVGNPACIWGIGLETQNSGVVIRDNLIAGVKGLGTGPHAAGLLFGRGILASGSGAGLTIEGNTIGLDANGDPLLGSVHGIDLGDPVTHKLTMTDVVVRDNEIAGHIWSGILVGRDTAAARLEGNSIHDNGTLGIDLVPASFGYGVTPNDPFDADGGGNGAQNFPVLEGVLRTGGDLRVFGALDSQPAAAFTLEFFASPSCDDSGHGEGQLPLGTTGVTTDGNGHAPFDVLLAAAVPAGWIVSATATAEPLGATSEFAACMASAWRDEGHALAGAAGAPRAHGVGDLSGNAQHAVVLGDAAPSALSALFLAASGNPVPFKGGTLMAFPWIGAPLALPTDAAGGLSLSFHMPAGVPAGAEVWLQWAVQDGGAPAGVALSNALVGTTP